jgi:hypothetical protein
MLLLLIAGKAWADQPSPVRIVDAPCRFCHAAIFDNYLATPMANASGLAADNVRPGVFTPSASGTIYEVSRTADQPRLAYQSRTTPADKGAVTLLYFLGSGHLGTTYLYSKDGFLFESPIAWYAASNTYDMKPGLEELNRMPPPLPMQSGCMRCHMSGVQASDPGTINRYAKLPFLHSGITCESCHGDSTQHLASNGKAAIVNPSRLTADRRDSVCISCHLEGDITVERSGHSPLDYRPGQSMSMYLAFYVRAGANLTDRAVSEVEQLNQSTCKRVSGDRMSCMSCHDPHFTPGPPHRAAFFRSKCLACHSQPAFASTHHPENQDCTSCHMPRAGARNILHVAWTDHRIRKVPAPASPAAEAPSTGELIPIFSPQATKRDQAMADYKALLGGDPSRETAAWNELNAIRSEIADDKNALDALGNLAAQRAAVDVAEQSFRRVLALDPDDLTALSNLAILLARQGKLKESADMLQRAFNRNQDVAGLAKNLARVQCITGDAQAARATLNTTLAYGPGLDDLRKLIDDLGACREASAPQVHP